MSDDWIEDTALRFEGFNDSEIKQIKAALPMIVELLQLYQKHLPDITRAKVLIDQLDPIAIMAVNRVKGRMT